MSKSQSLLEWSPRLHMICIWVSDLISATPTFGSKGNQEFDRVKLTNEH